MTMATSSDMGTSFLDGRPFSGFQIRTLMLCALVGILDGNDTQVMGIGAPSIAAALHVAPSAMGWAISGSWVGAAVGAVVLGGLADRVGRKPILVTAVLTFGLFTLLTPSASNLPALVAFRVLAGIGIGGATPCFIALASEYTPARWRASVVSLVWAAFPLGILIGGLSNGWMLSQFSWHLTFYVGGTAPIVIALLLLTLLPESIGFLLLRRPGDRRTAKIMAAVAPGLSLQTVVQMATGLSPRQATGVMDLFRSGRAKTTLCLWLLLFACFGTTASMAWLPTILQQHGASPAASAVAASFLGFGALLGMAVSGQLIDRLGIVRALVGPIVAGAAATAAMGIWPGSVLAASVFVTLLGALVGIGASGGISVVTLVYPTAMRSTGAGWAMGMARAGQVVIPGVFAVLLHGGWTAPSIFGALGSIPLVAAGAVLLLDSALRTTQAPASLPTEGLAPHPLP